MKRIPLGLLIGTLLGAAPQAYSASLSHVEKQTILRTQVRELKQQNQSLKERLDRVENLLQQVLANQKPSTSPTAHPPPQPQVSKDEPPLSDEEAKLAAEFAAEFGDEPAAPVLPSLPPPTTTSSSSFGGSGGSSFWGTGGTIGQSGSGLNLGFTSEFLFGWGEQRQGSSLSNTANLRESELAVGGYVDPYHRADALLIWNAAEDEMAIEEGYLTFFNLPEGWRARIGKFRSRFGRSNGLHLADLPWIDFPLSYQRFLGEEGFGAPGARLTYMGEPHGKWSWSMDIEAFKGDNQLVVDPFGLPRNQTPGGNFDADRFARNIVLAGHLQNHFQLDDTTGLEVGYSRLLADRKRVKFDGLDLTWRKLTQPGRNEWKVQWEGLRTVRDDLATSGNNDRIGWYLWGDRRFDRNRAAGFRIDRAENLAAASQADDSWLAYFTYYPTEFTWYRLQYQEETTGSTNLTDKRVMLQFRWQLGTDRHALQ
jgi:hypothetical protein